MKQNPGGTNSPWEIGELMRQLPLAIDLQTDVCIVGAGIAGMTTAYLLACEGCSVKNRILLVGPHCGADRYGCIHWSHAAKRKNVFVVTGDSGQGMIHGTIAGILLTDLIQGRQNEWADIYNPSRLRSISTVDFLNESLTVTAHYTDWLTGGEVSSTEEIGRDEGCIVVAASQRSRPIATSKACFTSDRPSARTWTVLSHGTRLNRAGIVPVTAPVSTSWPPDQRSSK
jgi:hypothetical protein